MDDEMKNTFGEAVAAISERGSAIELLMLYDRGLACFSEILSIVLGACYERPSLLVDLIKQFQAHPNNDIGNYIAELLERHAGEIANRSTDDEGTDDRAD